MGDINPHMAFAPNMAAVKILEGKAEPKDMPIEYQENADLIINKDTVKTLGIKIPEKLKKEAKMVTTQKKTDKE